jgi:co-chaperonin GroES (HSP10)
VIVGTVIFGIGMIKMKPIRERKDLKRARLQAVKTLRGEQRETEREQRERNTNYKLKIKLKIMLQPSSDYIIIEEIKDVYTPKKTDGGIVLTPGLHESKETGQFELAEKLVRLGKVVWAGPECKFYQPDDVIYFQKTSVYPIPYRRLGLYIINERQIMCKIVENENENENGDRHDKWESSSSTGV